MRRVDQVVAALGMLPDPGTVGSCREERENTESEEPSSTHLLSIGAGACSAFQPSQVGLQTAYTRGFDSLKHLEHLQNHMTKGQRHSNKETNVEFKAFVEQVAGCVFVIVDFFGEKTYKSNIIV